MYRSRRAYIDREEEFPTTGNIGRTIGIVGASRIGRMVIQVEYAIGLGPIGMLPNGIQEPGMRAGMRTSMANLDRLIRSEASAASR